jgi:small conductance mechanosensitive channel
MYWSLVGKLILAGSASGEESALVEAAQETKKNVNAFQTWLQDSLPGMISFSIKVLVALAVFFIGAKAIRAFVRYNQKRMDGKGLDKGVSQFLNSVLKFGLYALLAFFILAQFGVTASSIAAILASSGLTLGLALQGSLSNFAGGVLILLQKPFVVGDYIVEDTHGNEGTVVHISMIYTTLLTYDNQTVVIPNGTLANTSLRNLTHAGKRMEDLTVGISYGSDIKLAKVLLEKAAKKDEAVLKDEEVTAFVRELSDSSIDMGLRCWVEPGQYVSAKWHLLEQIYQEFSKYGIEIPYPQVTVSFHQNGQDAEKEE